MVDDKNASTTGAAAPLMTVPHLPPTIQVLQLVQDSQQQMAPVFGITPRLVIDMSVWSMELPVAMESYCTASNVRWEGPLERDMRVVAVHDVADNNNKQQEENYFYTLIRRTRKKTTSTQ